MFIDKVLDCRWEPPAWFRPLAESDPEYARQWIEIRDDIRRKAGACEVISADNVSEFLFARNLKEYWEYKTDFPCSAPPFSRFFLEMGRPSSVLDEKGVHALSSWVPRRWGWLFEAITCDEATGDFGRHADAYRQFIEGQIVLLAPRVDHRALEAAGHSPDFQSALDKLDDLEKSFVTFNVALSALRQNPGSFPDAMRQMGVGWILRGTCLVDAGNDVVCGPLGDYSVYVGAKGEILVDPQPMLFGTGGVDDRGDIREVASVLSTLYLPALLAVSFMNCKNVTLTPVDPPERLNRARVRRGRLPFVRYHTIDIEPLRRVLRSEGNIEANGLRKALHLVRGHFSTYTPERPLFGKVAGTFWVPSHVRGSAKEGVVFKDYRVNAPSEEVES